MIWTDLFQLLVMFASLFMIIGKGVYDLENGLADVYRINRDSGHLDLFDFNPDPFVRQSFWSLTIGFFCVFAPFYCADQQMLQRFHASKTKKLAQTALVLNAPGGFIIISLCTLVGLIM